MHKVCLGRLSLCAIFNTITIFEIMTIRFRFYISFGTENERSF